MSWNNQKVLNVIELYQKEPVLWDPTHRFHKDKKQLHDAWVRISEQVGVSVPELKRKRDSLMATYRGHLRKIKQSQKAGAGSVEVYKPIWFAFDVMHAFLKQLYERKKTTNTENQMDNRTSRSSSDSHKKSVLQSLIEGPEQNEKRQESAFDIRPDLTKLFKSTTAKEIIGKVLHELLHEKQYSPDTAEELTKTIANTVRNKLEGEMYERYKLVVNVVLGQRKGEGVKVGARCLWDPETDSFASDNFINETLFCVVTVYGILFY